jgi:uncharacterized membrane protein YagU involved in acid resistance
MVVSARDKARNAKISVAVGASMKILKPILIGGLVAGAFDITYATSISYVLGGVPPIRIFQSVAAGWVGREAARAGGLETAILGGVTHFTFTCLFAAAYVLVSFVWRDLLRRPYQWGPLYGAWLYFMMNFIVVPNSALGWPKKLPPPEIWWSGLFVHMFLVGLPIALAAQWFLLRDEETAATH